MSSPASRPPQRPFSLGRKAGLLFASLGLGLVVLTVQDVRQLRMVRDDARKLVEETREARAAQELRSTIEQLHLLARHLGSDDFAGERRILFERMTGHLVVLAAGRPGETDPSRREHESEEQRIVSDLRAGLERLVADADAGVGAVPTDLLWGLEEAAAEVEEETAEEAARASRDLEQRVQGLIGVMSATAAVSLLVLLLFFRLVHRHVVRPVGVLRRGAELLGAGRLDHRIRIDSADEIGELAGAFNLMADRLTETHRDLEERVRARTEEFIRAARLADLGTFAAGVAHEVNTPLASIASCAEGLERRVRAGEATAEVEIEYLRTIAHEAYRAHEITERLLDFARQDHGPVGPVDPGVAVGNVARLVEHELARSDLRLEVDCHDDLPPITGNSAELEQVLLNLVLNARDASPPGARIRLACRHEPDALVLEVEDEGPGIDPEHASRMFDPFFTTKPPGKGTGLGLSLVYRIVESHGGKVAALTAPSGGALFRVRLPLAAAGSAGVS